MQTFCNCNLNSKKIFFCFTGIFNSSSNPLLEFCLDGGYLKDAEGHNREDLSSLLELCSDFSSSFLSTWAYPKRSVRDEVASFEERLEHICQTGCDINVQSSQGFTALHFLINGKKNIILSKVVFNLLI